MLLVLFLFSPSLCSCCQYNSAAILSAHKTKAIGLGEVAIQEQVAANDSCDL
jgi:hypothetical protein